MKDMFSGWAFEDAGRMCLESKNRHFLCSIQLIRNYKGFPYQIEVTSKLKSLSNYNIASDMLAFTRAPKELTRILKHPKRISIGTPREFVGILKHS